MGVEYRRRCLGLGEIEWQPPSCCSRETLRVATLSRARIASSFDYFNFLVVISLLSFLFNPRAFGSFLTTANSWVNLDSP